MEERWVPIVWSDSLDQQRHCFTVWVWQPWPATPLLHCMSVLTAAFMGGHRQPCKSSEYCIRFNMFQNGDSYPTVQKLVPVMTMICSRASGWVVFTTASYLHPTFIYRIDGKTFLGKPGLNTIHCVPEHHFWETLLPFASRLHRRNVWHGGCVATLWPDGLGRGSSTVANSWWPRHGRFQTFITGSNEDWSLLAWYPSFMDIDKPRVWQTNKQMVCVFKCHVLDEWIE